MRIGPESTEHWVKVKSVSDRCGAIDAEGHMVAIRLDATADLPESKAQRLVEQGLAVILGPADALPEAPEETTAAKVERMKGEYRELYLDASRRESETLQRKAAKNRQLSELRAEYSDAVISGKTDPDMRRRIRRLETEVEDLDLMLTAIREEQSALMEAGKNPTRGIKI